MLLSHFSNFCSSAEFQCSQKSTFVDLNALLLDQYLYYQLANFASQTIMMFINKRTIFLITVTFFLNFTDASDSSSESSDSLDPSMDEMRSVSTSIPIPVQTKRTDNIPVQTTRTDNIPVQTTRTDKEHKHVKKVTASSMQASACLDDKTFRVNGVDKKSCRWIRKSSDEKKESYCTRARVRRHCPNACDAPCASSE